VFVFIAWKFELTEADLVRNLERCRDRETFRALTLANSIAEKASNDVSDASRLSISSADLQPEIRPRDPWTFLTTDRLLPDVIVRSLPAIALYRDFIRRGEIERIALDFREAHHFDDIKISSPRYQSRLLDGASSIRWKNYENIYIPRLEHEWRTSKAQSAEVFH